MSSYEFIKLTFAQKGATRYQPEVRQVPNLPLGPSPNPQTWYIRAVLSHNRVRPQERLHFFMTCPYLRQTRSHQIDLLDARLPLSWCHVGTALRTCLGCVHVACDVCAAPWRSRPTIRPPSRGWTHGPQHDHNGMLPVLITRPEVVQIQHTCLLPSAPAADIVALTVQQRFPSTT